MEQFKNIPAYELLKSERLEDVKGTGLLFRHKKSGARIGVISNTDENKVFFIGFKTPPKNSTGVAHITEHSVLCGSEKFPLKEPFVELCKGSLNTFLNAFTYPDKTVYPIASCNTKDFNNLMDVYMDAVLNPNIHTRPEIFWQEGWHYELNNEEDELKLNGVVYSEMKGAYSSPDELFGRKGMDCLFPDTEYGVDSGGDPEIIPELSYEEFKQFHKTFYHPSNSYIWLYGDMDVEERLNWLDSEYLSKYEKISVDSSIKVQKPFGVKEVKDFYPIDEPDPSGKGVFYSYNVLAGENYDLVKGIGFEILGYCLFGAPGAPVRQALLDAGLGDDVINYFDGENLQPYFSIGVKNAKAGQKDKFISVIRKTLEKVVKEGVKEETIRASINAQEFRYKEADFGRFPKGLMYGTTALSTWLYDDDMVFTTLHMNEAYEAVRAKIGTGWFESLITEYFLNPKHGIILTFEPKIGLNEENADRLAKKLADYKASLTKEELAKIIENTKRLNDYQSKEDSPEALRTIPLLEISDIDGKAKPYRIDKAYPEIADVVWSNYDTNGIAYVKACFKADGLDASELGYAGLLTDMLSMVNTQKHNYSDLNDAINMTTGGFSCDITCDVSDKDQSISPYIYTAIKALYPQADQAIDFVSEIVTGSLFDDIKRNREILFEVRTDLEAHMTRNGTGLMRDRAAAYDNEAGLFFDETSGIGFYDFLRKITDNYDSMATEISERLKEVTSKLFTRENLFGLIICDEKGVEICKPGFERLVEALPHGKGEKKLELHPVVKNEGFKISGQVQYVVRAGNYRKAGLKYTGVYNVLGSLLNYGYLWNEVRVKGGAYGAGFGVNFQTGLVTASSYRDPNLRRTNEIFEGLVDYIKNFDADEREMTKAIIGTFGNWDTPMSPRQMGERSFAAYRSGRDISTIQKMRDEALRCTAEDIRNTEEFFREFLKAGIFCTVGSSAAIEECKDMFTTVKTLI